MLAYFPTNQIKIRRKPKPEMVWYVSIIKKEMMTGSVRDT